jgi:hypothetical protein
MTEPTPEEITNDLFTVDERWVEVRYYPMQEDDIRFDLDAD